MGLAAVRALVEDGWPSAIGWIVDPDSVARERAVSELGGTGLAHIEQLPAVTDGVAVVAFSSRADDVVPVIRHLLSTGFSVVTTCEELARPSPSVKAELNGAAEKAARVVIVTGANPGFVMDRLPLFLAAGCRVITEIRIRRLVDTKQRRLPLVAKTGKGLSPDEFASRVADGDIGHVGLEASLLLVADGLGWPGGELASMIEPVLGAHGLVAGLHQVASMETSGGNLHYDLTMSASVQDSLDEVIIEAVPRIEVRIVGGYHGDLGTTALVANAARRLGSLDPGFYRPTGLPIA